MKCPKCKHQWTATKKRAAGAVLLGREMTSPGQIFEQKCMKCERKIHAGEKAFAYKTLPIAACAECGAEKHLENRSEFMVVDVVKASPVKLEAVA